jgi:hypothetical protein
MNAPAYANTVNDQFQLTKIANPARKKFIALVLPKAVQVVVFTLPSFL